MADKQTAGIPGARKYQFSAASHSPGKNGVFLPGNGNGFPGVSRTWAGGASIETPGCIAGMVLTLLSWNNLTSIAHDS